MIKKYEDDWGIWDETAGSSGVKVRVLRIKKKKFKDWEAAQPKPKTKYIVVQVHDLGGGKTIEISRSNPTELTAAQRTKLEADGFTIEQIGN